MSKLRNKSFEFYSLAIFMLVNLVLCWVCVFVVKDNNTYILEVNLMLFLAVAVVHYLVKLLQKYRQYENLGEKPEIKAILDEADVLYPVILVLALCAVVSTIFAIDRSTAVFGEYSRDEGMYSLFGYYMLFVVASKIKSDEEKKLLFQWFIMLGLIICFVGILAGWGCLNPITKCWKNTAAIPFGNSNTYGSFASTVFAGTVGLYLYAEDKRKRIVGLIGTIISAGAVFACSSSSPLVGNILVFIYVFMYGFVKKKNGITVGWKRILIVFAVYFAVMFISDVTRGGAVLYEFSANKSEIADAIAGVDGARANMLSSRTGAWLAAIKLMPEYWLTGVGVDNFKYAMNMEGVPEFLSSYDKAHNEYVQIMMCEGAFAIITYLVFLFIIFFRTVRHRAENVKTGNHLYISLYLMFISYLAQAFFNYSVPWVCCYFWILVGLLSIQGRKSII